MNKRFNWIRVKQGLTQASEPRARRVCTCFCALVLLLACSVCAAGGDKIVIAHRGASAYLPEHTLEAYAMAYAQGADYIEPDVVMTKDARFICLHDVRLESTTDVETAFPDRKRDDGRWYAADFTLEEIKRLRVHERLPNRFPANHAAFEVPTFEEMIELVQGLNKTTQGAQGPRASSPREVGIYPELKAPSWHRRQGLPVEQAFLDVVTRYGYKGKDARIFVQCFEPATLQMLREELKSELPQIMLMGGRKPKGNPLTEADLDRIAAYADGIGPAKQRIEEQPELVQWAHARGMAVHPYTFRADDLVKKYESLEKELDRFYLQYDVDGLFTDFPDRAARFLASKGQ